MRVSIENGLFRLNNVLRNACTKDFVKVPIITFHKPFTKQLDYLLRN